MSKKAVPATVSKQAQPDVAIAVGSVSDFTVSAAMSEMRSVSGPQGLYLDNPRIVDALAGGAAGMS